MSKKTKILSILLIVLCCMLQFVVIPAAVTEGNYSKTLPNWQEKVELISGTNASASPARTYMSFTGGTANYIYVQTQFRGSGAAVTDGWQELQKTSDDYYYSIWYNSSLGAGTALKVMAYQRNVLSKTASGYIYI